MWANAGVRVAYRMAAVRLPWPADTEKKVVRRIADQRTE